MSIAQSWIDEGFEQGIEKGIEKGHRNGLQEATFEITRNMLAEGLPLDCIKRVTRLSEEKILELRY